MFIEFVCVYKFKFQFKNNEYEEIYLQIKTEFITSITTLNKLLKDVPEEAGNDSNARRNGEQRICEHIAKCKQKRFSLTLLIWGANKMGQD